MTIDAVGEVARAKARLEDALDDRIRLGAKIDASTSLSDALKAQLHYALSCDVMRAAEYFLSAYEDAHTRGTKK